MTCKLLCLLLAIVFYGKAEEKKLQIVNGATAPLSSIPYQAYIKFVDSSLQTWICGGSLISTKYVLTSARCTYQAKNATILLGAVNIVQTSETSRQLFDAEKIIPHKDFNEDVLFNDIALIELLGIAILNNDVNIIQLPLIDSLEKDLVDQNATVSGWGRLDTASSFAETLQVGEVSVINIRVCEERYYDLVRKERQICTYNGNISRVTSCEGDFGGPVVINNTLYGVQSFSSSIGCEIGYPTISTKVAYYLNWISKIMSS